MQLPKLVKICLTALALSLSACAHDFPELHVHVIKVDKGLCGQYKEVSIEPLQFKFVGWKPLAQCDGFFALPPEDVAAIRAWYNSQPK